MCEELNENIKEIISIKNGQKYEFSINDSFGSKNRRRINIMNIPEENFLNQENQKEKLVLKKIQIHFKFVNL